MAELARNRCWHSCRSLAVGDKIFLTVHFKRLQELQWDLLVFVLRDDLVRGLCHVRQNVLSVETSIVLVVPLRGQGEGARWARLRNGELLEDELGEHLAVQLQAELLTWVFLLHELSGDPLLRLYCDARQDPLLTELLEASHVVVARNLEQVEGYALRVDDFTVMDQLDRRCVLPSDGKAQLDSRSPVVQSTLADCWKTCRLLLLLLSLRLLILDWRCEDGCRLLFALLLAALDAGSEPAASLCSFDSVHCGLLALVILGAHRLPELLALEDRRVVESALVLRLDALRLRDLLLGQERLRLAVRV